MQNVKTRDVVVYMTLPGVIPRIRQLISSGFSYVCFLMAHIYCMVRLLPDNHPYLMRENMGRYGLYNVIVEASRNLTFSRKNIDQILVYFAMLSGIVMLVMQIILALLAVFMPSAMAFSWFDTAVPLNDVAYNILDQVFGVPGLFCSSFTPANCTAYSAANFGAPPTTPLPFHEALHSLFQFYSTGLLLIAVLIFFYFIVVILVETVTTGTPFGKRFQNVWVPVRLVVALGLLMPLNYGLGSGQYIVLYAAKWGSSFATNGWEEYNTTVATHPMFGGTVDDSKPYGERYTTVAIPEAPSMAPVVEMMSIVHACAYSYARLVSGTTNATHSTGASHYGLHTDVYSAGSNAAVQWKIDPYFVKKLTASMAGGPIGSTSLTGNVAEFQRVLFAPRQTYLDALGFYYGSDIIIRFGERAVDPTTPGPVANRDPRYSDTGNVKPLCGDVRIPVADLSDIGGAAAGRGGPDHMLRFYYDAILRMWFDDVSFRQFARAWVNADESEVAKYYICTGIEGGGADSLAAASTGAPLIYPTDAECMDNAPGYEWRRDMIIRYNDALYVAIREAWANYVQNSVYANMRSDLVARGWGGAGIWYNKISEINGGWISGVNALPSVVKYPDVMLKIKGWREKYDQDLAEPYMPWASAPSGFQAPDEVDYSDTLTIGSALGTLIHGYWGHDTRDPSSTRTAYQNPFLDAIQSFLGLSGLMSIRGANAHLHPLAQLSAVGKSLVDSAINNITAATGAAFLGGAASVFEKFKGPAAALNAFSGMFESIAFIGLTAGVVLYYVLPFLPFLYFYFAVASWVKAVFEAMVGVPLWALAHLRIDGDGLPGDAAQNGYFLILEIFIRPILTVVGLVAAIAIFGTQVRVLNIIWDLVTTNVGGYADDLSGGTSMFDILGMNDVEGRRYQRGIVDQFFFTVIYTIICYMMALSSFKLIDKIPDNILRWAGAGVSSFGDMDQDNIDSLSRYATMGTMTLGGQAVGAVKGAAGQAGKLAGEGLKNATASGQAVPAGQRGLANSLDDIAEAGKRNANKELSTTDYAKRIEDIAKNLGKDKG